MAFLGLKTWERETNTYGEALKILWRKKGYLTGRNWLLMEMILSIFDWLQGALHNRKPCVKCITMVIFEFNHILDLFALRFYFKKSKMNTMSTVSKMSTYQRIAAKGTCLLVMLFYCDVGKLLP